MAQKNRPRRNRASSLRQKPRLPPESHQAQPAKSGSFGSNRLTSTPYLVAYLLLISFIAYANAWPDSLTLDDNFFAASGRYDDLGLKGLLGFFNESLWSANSASASLYRPLLLVSFATDAFIFGDWVRGYHLVNILLHLIATTLVFGFIGKLLLVCDVAISTATQTAFLAALIFGVHPIHTEVVNSIFNRSEILVTIGVTGGLWWFLKTYQHQTSAAWAGLSLVYLLALLCRESAASLPGLVIAMVWLTNPEPWKNRLRSCLPVMFMLIPLGIYLLLRANALDGGSDPGISPGAAAAGPDNLGATDQATESLGLESLGVSIRVEKLAPAISLWLESIKSLLWPHPLQIYYNDPKNPFWLALVLQLGLLGAAAVGYFQNRKGLLLGLAFFYLAILPSSRIIGESSINQTPVLADRLLYLPSVGLSIILAFALVWLAGRYKTRIWMAATVALTLVLIPVTWARNVEWESDIRLFESDYLKLKNQRPILMTLVSAHVREGQMERGAEICDQHTNTFRSMPRLTLSCGFAYGHVGRYQDAEAALLIGSKRKQSMHDAHFQLASMYLHLGRRSEAEHHFEQSWSGDLPEFQLHFRKAMALIQLYPNYRVKLLEAKSEFEKALELQPQHYESRDQLEILNRKLTVSNRRKNRG
jgi:tetratricopeptide (TPR) repeat protein